MTKLTIRNIKAGDLVVTGYRDNRWKAKFLGFTDRSERYGTAPRFDTFKELAAAGLGSNLREVEAKDGEREYGHHVYALFLDLNDGTTYGAYVFEGRFCLGSSADRMILEDRI